MVTATSAIGVMVVVTEAIELTETVRNMETVEIVEIAVTEARTGAGRSTIRTAEARTVAMVVEVAAATTIRPLTAHRLLLLLRHQ